MSNSIFGYASKCSVGGRMAVKFSLSLSLDSSLPLPIPFWFLAACFGVDGSVLHERSANSAVKAAMTSCHSPSLCSRTGANTWAPLPAQDPRVPGLLLFKALLDTRQCACFRPWPLSPHKAIGGGSDCRRHVRLGIWHGACHALSTAGKGLGLEGPTRENTEL